MNEMVGQIRIPPDQFRREVVKQYRNAYERFGIEKIQNSLDARADWINFEFDNSTRTITVTDNGCGMDRQTVLDAYLSLGGSHKPNPNSVGAFGEAKKLDFGMKSWKIRTRNVLVVGKGAQFTLSETGIDFLGCQFTLEAHREGDYQYDYFRGAIVDVAAKMEIPMEIRVDGRPIPCAHPRGAATRQIIHEGAKIGQVYIDSDRPVGGDVNFRINGIWLFSRWVSDYCPAVTIELGNDSAKFLISSREGITYPYTRTVDTFLAELSANTKSALCPEQEIVRETIPGTEAQSIMDDLDLDFLHQKMRDGGLESFTRAFVARVLSVGLDDVLAQMRLAAEKVDELIYDEPERLAYFTFQFDTKVKYPRGEKQAAREFIDGGPRKAKTAKTLLTLWGEVLKQVCLDNQKYLRFSVGLNWDETQLAECESGDNGTVFYIHPKVLEDFPLTNKKLLVRRLRQFAIHELTHALGFKWHDESFLVRCQDVDKSTWQSDRLYDKIAKL